MISDSCFRLSRQPSEDEGGLGEADEPYGCEERGEDGMDLKEHERRWMDYKIEQKMNKIPEWRYVRSEDGAVDDDDERHDGGRGGGRAGKNQRRFKQRKMSARF